MLRHPKVTAQRNTSRCRAAVTVGAKRRGLMSGRNSSGFWRLPMKCAKRGSAIRRAIAGTFALGAMATAPSLAKADEGGVSFWIPGLFGSLAASPLQPGFSFGTIYYHTSVNAGADVAFAREVPLGRITTNFTGNLNIGLKADVDLGIAVPSYTFAERF